MEAIILAGGFGTRLRQAVADVPKPLAPVAGRPFLEHLLDYWIGQGVRRAILAVGFRHDLVRTHFGAAYRGCELEYSVEDTPLGTGGALLAAAGLLRWRAPFLALNGDTYFAVPLARLEQAHRDGAATLSLFRSKDGKRYTGVTMGGAGRVSALSAPPDGEVLANGGVTLLSRSALDGLPSWKSVTLSLEKDVLEAILRADRPIHGYICDGAFVDIGVPEDWRAAAGIIEGTRSFKK